MNRLDYDSTRYDIDVEQNEMNRTTFFCVCVFFSSKLWRLCLHKTKIVVCHRRGRQRNGISIDMNVFWWGPWSHWGFHIQSKPKRKKPVNTQNILKYVWITNKQKTKKIVCVHLTIIPLPIRTIFSVDSIYTFIIYNEDCLLSEFPEQYFMDAWACE